jgi:hypothetical protein
LSTFIHREIAKTTIAEEEVYVCMYVHENILVNLLFFRKIVTGFEELIKQKVTPEHSKELVRRVRENEVEKVTKKEAKFFNESLNQHEYRLAVEIKETLSKTNQEIKVEHVGAVAGLQYLVVTSKHMEVLQLYMLQRGDEGFSAGYVPAQFVEMTLLDYVHHMKFKDKPIFIMIDENQYFTLKKSNSNSRIIYVVKVDMFPESVSASKAYMISKKNLYDYVLLPIEESTPELIEGLKEEGKKMVDAFIKKMNIGEQ